MIKNLTEMKKSFNIPSRISLCQDGFGNCMIKDFVVGHPVSFLDMIEETIEQARIRKIKQIYYLGKISIDDLRVFAMCGFEGECLPPEDQNVWVVWANL